MTLIKDSYFVAYAEELACDVGLIKDPLHWPFDCIDWGAAADELQGDYSSVDFAGETYLGAIMIKGWKLSPHWVMVKHNMKIYNAYIKVQKEMQQAYENEQTLMQAPATNKGH